MKFSQALENMVGMTGRGMYKLVNGGKPEPWVVLITINWARKMGSSRILNNLVQFKQ